MGSPRSAREVRSLLPELDWDHESIEHMKVPKLTPEILDVCISISFLLLVVVVTVVVVVVVVAAAPQVQLMRCAASPTFVRSPHGPDLDLSYDYN